MSSSDQSGLVVQAEALWFGDQPMLNELQWGLTMTYMAPSYAVKEMLESARSIASDFTWMGSQGEVSVKPHARICTQHKGFHLRYA